MLLLGGLALLVGSVGLLVVLGEGPERDERPPGGSVAEPPGSVPPPRAEPPGDQAARSGGAGTAERAGTPDRAGTAERAGTPDRAGAVERPGRAATTGTSRPIRLRAAQPFDPYGGDGEHADRAPLAMDGDPATTWTTQEYAALAKPGVGLIVDAGRPVAARTLTIRTPTPGFTAEVRGARGRAPSEVAGWTGLARERVVSRSQRFRLAAGGERHRRYLVWITALPGGAGRAEVGEVTVRR